MTKALNCLPLTCSAASVPCGLTLDIFDRHADKIVIANVAQLINNLHSG